MDVGTVLVAIGLLATVCSAVAHVRGVRARSNRWLVRGRQLSYAAAISTVTALGLLLYYFLTDNFAIAYVAQNSMREQALIYKISGVWGGQSGSMLMWAAYIAVFGAIVARTRQKPDLGGYASAIVMATGSLFLGMILFTANPFELSVHFWDLSSAPMRGLGLNPLLRNPGMFFHPPTLYAGYAGFVVPFAFALAGLWLRDDDWVDYTRRWTVFAWVFLTVGILVGGWWAYVILGWGGYWAWDPVENASLLPWLTGTAFLHSVMIQEKRNMLRLWNQVLIILTYLLTIYGVFLTRSGVVESVHSFGESPVGPYMMAFMGIALVSSLAVIALRWNFITDDSALSQSVFSKEVSFLLNNLVLLGLALTVFWGTSFPFVSELLTGDQFSIGTSFYNQLTPPIAIGLVVLMGVCPLIPWQRASLPRLKQAFLLPVAAGLIVGVPAMLTIRPVAGLVLGVVAFVAVAHVKDAHRTISITLASEPDANPLRRTAEVLWNNRRRYGGYIVHFGVLVLIVGITWSSVFAVEEQTVVTDDMRTEIPGGYEAQLVQYQQEQVDAHTETGAQIAVFKNGQIVKYVSPSINEFPRSEMTQRDPAIWGQATRDMYFIFNGGEVGQASVTVKKVPFVNFVWYGGGLLVLGGIVALWPEVRTDESLDLTPNAEDSRSVPGDAD